MSISFTSLDIKRVSLLVFLAAVAVLAVFCLDGHIPMKLNSVVAWVVIFWDAAYISVAVMLVGVPLKRFLVTSYWQFLKKL